MARTFSSKVRTQTRVVNALLIRELMARYGHGNFGFVWMVLEPLLLTGGVIAVWSLIYGSARHGVNIVPFILTGYSMLTLWRHFIMRGLKCFTQATDLLFHRSVRPFDVLLARQISETFGILIAFFVVYIPLLLLDFTEPVDDYLLLLGAWFLMAFFCFGVGLILACLSELSEAVERFVQPLMYLLIPVSGAFYLVAWMPKPVQEILLLFPMIHASEMFRAGYMGPTVPTHWDAGYLLVCGLASNAIGFAMLSRATAKLEA